MNIEVKLTDTPKPKPTDESKLGFGSIFTDHMFIMEFNGDKGWEHARIEKFHDIAVSPAANVFHYGQEVFEGMKAYYNSGEIFIFRPDMNAKRINNSLQRLCMPKIDEEDFVEAVKKFVEVEKEWVPKSDGTTLYLRPFVIGLDSKLGVHPSSNYYFIIIAAPGGAYYARGIAPVSIWVEDEYVRAVRGGVGFTKTGGNYAASLLGQEKAEEHGCEQTLWLDGVERKYIEEVGSMNICFKIDGKIVTPMLNGSILPGVTRDSVITLCKDFGYEVEERRVSLDELMKAADSGKLEECFGTGTACVISPVGYLVNKDKKIVINEGKIGSLSQKLYDTLTGIQYNKLEDKHNWRVKVC
ncbi:MAG: branched-chain amino acid aminotransferase [Lachnospiraceae bacterium]|nr:branched-chain amino acid aminotransferase [Lachnospiraceae bacterium]